MMIINWLDEDQRKTFLSWVIAELIATEPEYWRLYADKHKNTSPPSAEMEVSCQINGIDVSFTKLVDVLSDLWEIQVNTAAKKMIEDKADKLEALIEKFEADVHEVVVSK